MKILHLLYESKGDYFGIGGVGIRAYEIYKYLNDRHDVTLLCKQYPGAEDGKKEGLNHIFVGTESKSLAKTLLSYAYKAARFVKKNGGDFDIIIEEFSPAIPTFLHSFTEKPVILQVQGYTGSLYFKKYNPVSALFLFSMERLRSHFYKNFIFISDNTVERVLHGNPFRTHFPKGGKGGLVEIIPNGISPELLDLSYGEEKYILYLGRIDVYGKGLDVLINAYKEFYQSFPDIKLVIAGDGRDREVFNTELMKLPEDIKKNIEFLGWVSGGRKIEVISRASFCVFPSRHEVQGIAVLEAMACGKAVIVSEISEFRYVTRNRAGTSFKTGDAFSLALSMKELITNSDRKEMGLRGKRWVKDFTWDKIALKYEQFLYTVLEKQSR